MKSWQWLIVAPLLLVYGGLVFLRISQTPVFAQEVFRSNTVCTKVGNPKDSDKPTACQGPANFQYYCQGDPRWANINGCDLGGEGCAPTSFAMIFSSYGILTTPPQMDSTFQSKGWRSCGNDATSFGLDQVVSFFQSQGFQVSTDLVSSNLVFDAATAKNYIDAGYLIVGAADNYPCGESCGFDGTRFAHVFVIDAVPSSTTIDIRDPSNCSYSNGQEALNGRIHQANGQFTWQFALAVKK